MSKAEGFWILWLLHQYQSISAIYCIPHSMYEASSHLCSEVAGPTILRWRDKSLLSLHPPVPVPWCRSRSLWLLPSCLPQTSAQTAEICLPGPHTSLSLWNKKIESLLFSDYSFWVGDTGSHLLPTYSSPGQRSIGPLLSQLTRLSTQKCRGNGMVWCLLTRGRGALRPSPAPASLPADQSLGSSIQLESSVAVKGDDRARAG